MDFKTLEPSVRKAFMDGLFQNLKIEDLRKFILVPTPERNQRSIQLFQYDDTTTSVVTVDEFADYSTITESDVISKATTLGAGCAITYNALLKNARLTHKHSVAWDLLDKENLRFTFVLNAGPSVADPLECAPGWVSFRFKFASWTSANSLAKGKTLEALETYAN
jgi:hypothetical protein